MAAVLLAAGAPGKRYALPNSRIMIHQGSGGFRGNAPDVVIQMQGVGAPRSRRTTRSSPSTPASRSTRSRKDTERDYFMSAEQAKDYGIIDAVYSATGDSLIAQAHDQGFAEARRPTSRTGGRPGAARRVAD